MADSILKTGVLFGKLSLAPQRSQPISTLLSLGSSLAQKTTQGALWSGFEGWTDFDLTKALERFLGGLELVGGTGTKAGVSGILREYTSHNKSLVDPPG